jgi:hypothetical protein
MAFLNPILLFGMTAIAAPILIHLLNRRKFEKVVWGAMRFLKVSIEQTQRRLQLEDLLLLLLRCLLVLLLAIALSRPTLRGSTAGSMFGQSKAMAVILLDNSYSMSQTDGITSRFDRGKKAALDALASMPSGSSASLILASDIAQKIIPEPTFDLNFVRKSIQDARLCDRGSDLMPALHEAANLLWKKSGRREIFLVTDGQANAFRQMNAIRSLIDHAKPDIQTHILLVGAPEQQNLAISDLKTMTEIPAVDQPLKFSVQVTNFGLVDASSVHVSLHIDSDPPCDEGVIDAIPRGQTKVITLFARLRSDQYHTITASLPADRLPADDSRTLAIHAVNVVNILLVDGNPAPEPRDAETFFLRHALVPVSRAETDRYFIKTRVIAPRELASQSLEDFDAIALCDVPDVPASMLESLASFLRRGNALLVFPGPDIDANFYNQTLARQWNFLPAEFGPAIGDAKQTEKFLSLQRKDFTHPVVDLWNDPAAGELSNAHFFRVLPLHPLPAPSPDQADAGEPRVMLTYTDDAQTPAVMERAFGAGRVVQFSSTASTKWNDLPAHAGLYLPLLRRTLGWAMQQQDRKLNVTVGDPLVFHPAADTLNQQAVIRRVGAAEGEQTSRPVEFIDHLPTLSFADTNLAGAYDIDLAGKNIKFAVQPKSSTSATDSESSLVDLAPPDIDLLRKSADVVLPGQSLTETLAAQQSGAELWTPIILIALILATLETVLAHWFSVPK